MAEALRVGIIANLSKSGAKHLLADLLARFEAASIAVTLEQKTADLAGQSGGLNLKEFIEVVDMIVVLGLSLIHI